MFEKIITIIACVKSNAATSDAAPGSVHKKKRLTVMQDRILLRQKRTSESE